MLKKLDEIGELMDLFNQWVIKWLEFIFSLIEIPFAICFGALGLLFVLVYIYLAGLILERIKHRRLTEFSYEWRRLLLERIILTNSEYIEIGTRMGSEAAEKYRFFGVTMMCFAACKGLLKGISKARKETRVSMDALSKE